MKTKAQVKEEKAKEEKVKEVDIISLQNGFVIRAKYVSPSRDYVAKSLTEVKEILEKIMSF